MVLTAQPFFVVVDLVRDADLVASGTKLRRFVERLQKGFLVKLGLGLDQLFVHEREQLVRAVGERIMSWLLHRVIGVATRAVDVRDRVARGAGDADLSCGMIVEIEIRIVERAAQKRHDVVTPGAPA